MCEDKKKYPHMVSLREAAESTGLSYYALRKAALSNQIINIRFAGKFYVNLDALMDQLNGEVENAGH